MCSRFRDRQLWNNLRWKYLHNIYINEHEKSKTSFEAFSSTCNHYIQRNEKIEGIRSTVTWF